MRTILLWAESSVTQPRGLHQPYLDIGLTNRKMKAPLYFQSWDLSEAKYEAELHVHLGYVGGCDLDLKAAPLSSMTLNGRQVAPGRPWHDWNVERSLTAQRRRPSAC
jgi:hypothetical protein